MEDYKNTQFTFTKDEILKACTKVSLALGQNPPTKDKQDTASVYLLYFYSFFRIQRIQHVLQRGPKRKRDDSSDSAITKPPTKKPSTPISNAGFASAFLPQLVTQTTSTTPLGLLTPPVCLNKGQHQSLRTSSSISTTPTSTTTATTITPTATATTITPTQTETVTAIATSPTTTTPITEAELIEAIKILPLKRNLFALLKQVLTKHPDLSQFFKVYDGLPYLLVSSFLPILLTILEKKSEGFARVQRKIRPHAFSRQICHCKRHYNQVRTCRAGIIVSFTSHCL